MSTASPLRMTPEEFYAWEKQQPVKHQYYRGEVFSMAGTSPAHNRICRNIWLALTAKLKGTKCEAFAIDLMVHTADGLDTYPDVFIVCGPLENEQKNNRIVTNPKVIFEVLSPSTEKYDRGLKFDHYKTIPSLQEYLLVAQDRVAVDHFTRTEKGWLAQDARSLDDSVVLACQGVALKLKDIYENIEIPTAEDANTAQLKIYGDER
jgi:Uma2 family endonuclease